MTPKEKFDEAQELSGKLEKLINERILLNSKKKLIHKRLYNIIQEIPSIEKELIESLK